MIYQRQFYSGQNKKTAREKNAVGWLRANPTDPVAVMALYETCRRELQEIAVRYFGKNQLGKKAVLNLLVVVVSRVSTCDLQKTRTKEWVTQCADGEAKRLRVALDAGSSRGRQTGRDV